MYRYIVIEDLLRSMDGPCYIQNRALTKHVIKRSRCITLQLRPSAIKFQVTNSAQSSDEILNRATEVQSPFDLICWLQDIKPDINNQHWLHFQQMCHLMGKPTICIGENKDADKLRGNREADQRLCFRYSDSTIPLLLKSEISSF